MASPQLSSPLLGSGVVPTLSVQPTPQVSVSGALVNILEVLLGAGVESVMHMIGSYAGLFPVYSLTQRFYAYKTKCYKDESNGASKPETAPKSKWSFWYAVHARALHSAAWSAFTISSLNVILSAPEALGFGNAPPASDFEGLAKMLTQVALAITVSSVITHPLEVYATRAAIADAASPA
eukprot:CAMPEP_0113696024 /NCGR_PEP_ID=MMETSP0038_2-20120614/21242_1 /TAXON_ID=2898 /ORGANISM="Cryptomonas paramecium" /LENGTH=179 /DNA_ID=CAMNT_0000618665 /DNA_START=16 /DNA_END=551 /DNA_ORIENTATION=+ /assembly_acc=CAM_ASM_000170